MAAIFGEYVGAFEGLGIWMQISRNAFRADLVFVAILIASVLSILLFVAVSWLEAATIPWYRASRRRACSLAAGARRLAAVRRRSPSADADRDSGRRSSAGTTRTAGT